MKNGKNKKKTKPKTKKARSPRRPQKSPANVSGYQTKADQGQESMGILSRWATGPPERGTRVNSKCGARYNTFTAHYNTIKRGNGYPRAGQTHPNPRHALTSYQQNEPSPPSGFASLSKATGLEHKEPR